MSRAGGPVEQAWREERLRIVAVLARRLGDLELAEDAVQEAFAAAAARWPAGGVPDRPGAWLTTTAWRKALDVMRRERLPLHAGGPFEEGATAAAAEDAVPGGPAAEEDSDLDLEDDRLRLILTCCHPALPADARVALTLRHVAGLTAREIAAALLLPEGTLSKRLVRARTKIRDARIAFTVPDRAALPERLADVHAVIYLVFTEGHLASGDGPAIRGELCEEAIWLARQLHAVVPEDGETTGLLALLVLQHARTPARQTGDGALVLYDEQDRDRWNGALIEEARALLATTGRGPLGPYQLQAAIAALHAAPSSDGPDWRRITDLYRVLARIAPSPVVEVNRAVAVGRAEGAAAGLAILERVLAEGRLDAYVSLHAAHADLLERAGSTEAARAAWRRAAALAGNSAQRALLLRRAAVASARPTTSPTVDPGA